MLQGYGWWIFSMWAGGVVLILKIAIALLWLYITKEEDWEDYDERF